MSIKQIKQRASSTPEYSCRSILSGEIDTTLPSAWWLSADGQGEMDMRDSFYGGSSLASALVDLLGECGGKDDTKSILKGSLTVREEEDQGEDLEDIGADDARPASRWTKTYWGYGGRSEDQEIDLEGKTMAEAAAYLRKMCASEAEVEEIESGKIFAKYTEREPVEVTQAAVGKLKMLAQTIPASLFDEEEEEES